MAQQNEPVVLGANPKLSKFIAEHARFVDDWSPEAFEDDLVGQKTSALYTFHTYWSKKDPVLINAYIRHYTRPGELVVDPFSGSGTTGLAALLSRRSVILIDASPSAALLSHFCCLPGSPEDVEAALERLLAKAGAAVDQLFETKCDRCGGPALTEYVIWSERFQCPKCAEYVPLFDCPEEKVEVPAPGGRGKTQLKKKRICPLCLANNGGKPHRSFVISTRAGKASAVPVLVRYKCSHCKPATGERRHNDDKRTRKGRFFEELDLAKLAQIDQQTIPHWYPNRKMMDVADDSQPWGVKWRAGTSNFRSVAELYTKRNLWALAALRKALGNTGLGQLETLLFTGLLHKCSHLMACNSDQVGRVTKGTYYVAPIRMECRPTKYLREAVSDLKRHFEAKEDSGYQGGASLISAMDARDGLTLIPNNAVDYAFTDPPYVDKIQYGELNFVWEAWLGLDGSWLDKEIIVNPYRKKDLPVWEVSMRQVLSEIFRVLKPGRWLSLCYHDTDPRTWTLVQNILLDVGFEIVTVTAQSTSQKSANQISGEKVVKSDLVLNCRKPRPDRAESNGNLDAPFISQRVRDILIETLTHTAGQTRDRLWDVVLKRLLARGQMAEHRFDDILADVAFISESGRWFLKEEYESLSENDIKNEERTGDALVRFARLRLSGVSAAFAAEIVLHVPQLGDAVIDEQQVEQYIRSTFIKDLKEAEKYRLGGRLKGVEFYDCLFFYLTRWLKGRPAGTTPRRNLAEFLGDYLVRYKDGDKWLYRVPNETEANSLKQARQTGLGRRIRQYVASLQGQGDFPTERMPDGRTQVAWLKHCATFGFAEEGVALFEKGGLISQLLQLSEEDRWDAEDYYAQCRRKVGKAASASDDDLDGEEADEEMTDGE